MNFSENLVTRKSICEKSERGIYLRLMDVEVSSNAVMDSVFEDEGMNHDLVPKLPSDFKI